MKRTPRAAQVLFPHFDPGHFEVEGLRFETAHKAYCFAVSCRGAKCCEKTFVARLGAGKTTWALLCAPPNEAGAAKRKASDQRKRAEMAEIIAALDARKAALA